MKKRLIVANWKMNPAELDLARHIFTETVKSASALTNASVVVCPPYVYLEVLSKEKGKVSLGGQDISPAEEGAHTGEVSAAMIKDLGASYAIVGHSERRREGDTDEIVNKKLLAGLKKGLTAVLCIGESVRDPDGAYLATISRQLEGALFKVGKSQLGRIAVAYEPVWAIGKGSAGPATPSDVLEVSLYILRVLTGLYGKDAAKVPILYGGSVDAKNAKSFVDEGGVSGLLVGRESLNPKAFGALLKSIDHA